MKLKKSRLIWSIIIIAIIILAAMFLLKPQNKPGKLDSFAKCLTASGAKFYGAFWCSHCHAQKLEFGSSAEFMPYVECSTADGKGQLTVCVLQNITGYPTWVFADGSMVSGEVSLQELAYRTNCVLAG